MQVKPDAKATSSDDPYYDIFLGGRLKPEDFLVEEDATAVRAAIELVQKFVDLLEGEDLLEER